MVSGKETGRNRDEENLHRIQNIFADLEGLDVQRAQGLLQNPVQLCVLYGLMSHEREPRLRVGRVLLDRTSSMEENLLWFGCARLYDFSQPPDNQHELQ